MGHLGSNTVEAFSSIYGEYSVNINCYYHCHEKYQEVKAQSQFEKLALWSTHKVQLQIACIYILIPPLIVCPWASFFTSPCHSLLICKMGESGSYFLWLLGRSNKMMHPNSLLWYQASRSPFYCYYYYY